MPSVASVGAVSGCPGAGFAGAGADGGEVGACGDGCGGLAGWDGCDVPGRGNGCGTGCPWATASPQSGQRTHSRTNHGDAETRVLL
jgi:hypothetical protein